MDQQPSYDPRSIRALFDEMAGTYGAMNLISSFGFAARWRSQAVGRLPEARPFWRVLDLMSGMGELWRSLAQRADPPVEVVAVDISPEMARRAISTHPFPVTIRVEDVFTSPFEPGSFDAVVCSFGLKTLSPDQQEELARLVALWLREGGAFSFVEISVPPNRLLNLLYMLYVGRLIPIIGRLFLGNPDCYRMLGVYTTAFRDCRPFALLLERAGLRAEYVRYFFGCATGVVGHKPSAD